MEGGEYVKSAKIGRAVMDADVFISLTHFKGHEQAGMGGALKNIGMGCGSRAGKMEQRQPGKPFVKQKKCIGRRACARICAHGAPQFGADGKATIDTDKCVGCARCLAVCPKDAIQCLYDEAPAILNKKIAEYTKAVVDGRPCFHVSLVVDSSPNCDCHAENDVPHRPGCGHVCLLRSGGSGPSLCRRGAGPDLLRPTPPCLTRVATAPPVTTSTPPIRTRTGPSA